MRFRAWWRVLALTLLGGNIGKVRGGPLGSSLVKELDSDAVDAQVPVEEAARFLEALKLTFLLNLHRQHHRDIFFSPGGSTPTPSGEATHRERSDRSESPSGRWSTRIPSAPCASSARRRFRCSRAVADRVRSSKSQKEGCGSKELRIGGGLSYRTTHKAELGIPKWFGSTWSSSPCSSLCSTSKQKKHISGTATELILGSIWWPFEWEWPLVLCCSCWFDECPFWSGKNFLLAIVRLKIHFSLELFLCLVVQISLARFCDTN